LASRRSCDEEVRIALEFAERIEDMSGSALPPATRAPQVSNSALIASTGIGVVVDDRDDRTVHRRRALVRRVPQSRTRA
jgi:hypothetical protein